MKSKQFHFESHDGKFYTALFSLTKVDDKEVYEFLAKEEKETDFLHYGYMTKAMAEKLLSKRERDGRMYIQSVSLKSNPKDIPQKQKIILDLPDKIDEKNFLPGGLPFQSASLTLYSKSYQEKLVPAVTIKPHSSFTFDTNESTVICELLLLQRSENFSLHRTITRWGYYCYRIAIPARGPSTSVIDSSCR